MTPTAISVCYKSIFCLFRRKASRSESRRRPPLIHRPHQPTGTDTAVVQRRFAWYDTSWLSFQSRSNLTAFYERWNKSHLETVQPFKRFVVWLLYLLLTPPFQNAFFLLKIFYIPTRNQMMSERFEGVLLSSFDSSLITDLLLLMSNLVKTPQCANWAQETGRSPLMHFMCRLILVSFFIWVSLCVCYSLCLSDSWAL